MVQMAFFLRFRLQLKRTRPNLVPRLEDMAVRAVLEAGGEIVGGSGTIRADFDENSPGFWLDMLFLVGRLSQIADEAKADLHGHSILLGETLPEAGERLCRLFSGGVNAGGVYLDAKVSEALKPYVTVDGHGKWAGTAFFRLREEKIFVSTVRTGLLLQEKNIRLFEPGHRPSVLVVGRAFEGRRDSLYRRLSGFSGAGASERGEGLPPLFVRFGRGGLNAIADSWPSWISQEDMDAEAWGKMAAMREFFFRHRLRSDPSPFAAGMAGEFFDTLLDLYGGRAAREGIPPVVILENVHAAERAAANIAIAALSARQDFILAGICADRLDKSESSRWEAIFSRQFDTEDLDQARDAALDAGRGAPTEIPVDLWEMGYLCLLIGRIFPPCLIPGALEEMGKSPGMISRSISMLHALRIIDTPLDPRPWQEDFQSRAEAALGERKDSLLALARRLLLAWVERKKISPCVSLLERLAELGCRKIGEGLILQAIHGELGCSDGAALESFADSESLGAVVGEARAPAFRYAAKTLLALHFGGGRKILDAFSESAPEFPSFPLLKTQALLNQSLRHLGWHGGDSAAGTIKAAMLLCQRSGHFWLSRCHRLFALASLSERRICETSEHLGFALENAVKSGDPQEIGMASYYTASVQLLHGNLSRALSLAKKALKHFLEAGSPEWADRSRFLEGRIIFENGGYGAAANIFGNALEKPCGGISPEKTGLLESWAYRADAYAMKSPPCPHDRVPDTDLFELEALYFEGNFSGMARLSEKLAEAPTGAEWFYGTEQADWRSGFSQCELLCFSWHDFRNRMLGAYRSLALSHLSSRDGNMAVYSLQQILQNSRFAEIDPCDTFYHYALYKVLRQTGAGQIDLRTAASKAHKRMQVRSGRIESPEIRKEYLTQPYWNKALEEAARELKLV